jgi:SagB-type dehydrogenase family enzyme
MNFKKIGLLFFLLILGKFILANSLAAESLIPLIYPETKKGGLNWLFNKRASIRSFSSRGLTKKEISELLWAAYGLKVDSISRASYTVASAGAIYPLEIFLILNKNIESELSAGMYQYFNDRHVLKNVNYQINIDELIAACYGQNFFADASAVIVITADYKRMFSRYRNQGWFYIYIEAGAVAQNIHLKAAELNLATVIIGAFDRESLHRLLKLDENLVILTLMPIGHPNRLD